MNFLPAIFLIAMLGIASEQRAVEPRPSMNVTFKKLRTLAVTGDFDGDGRLDSVVQHIFSRLNRMELETSPDPNTIEWDEVVKWFYDQQADVYLTMSNNLSDTLHLGTAHGLYCLINVGDNNADGKDEIALVIDQLDFSNLNSCDIYSLCNKKFSLVKDFGIHEEAFYFTSAEQPLFTSIKGFLEKQNGKWVCADYLNQLEGEKAVAGMVPLQTGKCK